MNIKIENFGLIGKGNININPLTIFIGPNNTGKSYAAILIKCLYSSISIMYDMRHGLSLRFTRTRMISDQSRQSFYKIKDETKNSLEKIRNSLEKGEKFEWNIPKNMIEESISAFFDIFKQVFTGNKSAYIIGDYYGFH